jgi:hypothetical protein
LNPTTARSRLAVAVAAVLVAIATVAGAQTPKPGAGPGADASAPTYLDLLRADLRREKAGVIDSGMELSETEAAPFWRVYRDYEADVARISDGRFGVLKEYAESFKAMTDAKAAEIMQRVFALDAERVGLKQRYFPRFAAATSPRTAARFFQIEGQLEALLYLQLTSDLPLFPRPGAPTGSDPLKPR